MQFLDIHTHRLVKKDNVLSIQSLSLTDEGLASLPKNEPIAVGLHPWYATLAKLETQLAALQMVAKQDNVVLIGECGLDSLRGEPLVIQEEILIQQILLAEELQKPVILHCVRAFVELIALKRKLQIQVPMVIHGFNKNEELGKRLLMHGFLLSFGKSILNPASGAAKLLAQAELFFLETDDSEIPIEEIYVAAANLKKCTVDELKACIFANWKKIVKPKL